MQCTMGMFFKQRPDFIRSVLHVGGRGEEITIFYNDILMRKIELEYIYHNEMQNQLFKSGSINRNFLTFLHQENT